MQNLSFLFSRIQTLSSSNKCMQYAFLLIFDFPYSDLCLLVDSFSSLSQVSLRWTSKAILHIKVLNELPQKKAVNDFLFHEPGY